MKRFSILLALLLCQLTVQAQLLELQDPTQDSKDLGTAIFKQLATTQWLDAESQRTTTTITLKSNFKEEVTVFTKVKSSFKDQGFHLLDGDTEVSNFTVPANGTKTLNIVFRPLHNINYDSEVFFYEANGRATLSIDLRGIGRYTESGQPGRVRPIESISITRKRNVQQDNTVNYKNEFYYEDTNDKSEYDLLLALRAITETAGKKPNGPGSFINGISNNNWTGTRRQVMLNTDNWHLNPYIETVGASLPPPDQGGTGTRAANQQYGIFVCPFTGTVRSTVRGDRTIIPNGAISTNGGLDPGTLGLPTYLGKQCSGGSPDYSSFDVEHTVPASLMTGFGSATDEAKSFWRYHDIHHLFPIESEVNQEGHSNYTYGDANFPSTSLAVKPYPAPSEPRRLGNNFLSFRHTSTVSNDIWTGSGFWFEPSKKQKGYTARAHLYMVTRYGDRVNTTNSTNKGWAGAVTNDIGWFELAKDVMFKWHNDVEVTPRELKRNNIVQGIQWNRNPYVDYPQFAWRISDYTYIPGKHPGEPGLQEVTEIILFEDKLNFGIRAATRDPFLFNYYVVSGGNVPIEISNLRIEDPTNLETATVFEPEVFLVKRNQAEEASRFELLAPDTDGKYFIPVDGSIVIRVKVQAKEEGSFTAKLRFDKLEIGELPRRWYVGVPENTPVTNPNFNDKGNKSPANDGANFTPAPSDRCYFRDPVTNNCLPQVRAESTTQNLDVLVEGSVTQGTCGPGPNFVEALPLSSTEVGLNWENKGTEYRLFIYDVASKITSFIDLPSTQTDYIEGGFTPGNSYRFTIASICSDGTLGLGQAVIIDMPATSPRLGSIDINPNPGDQQTNVNIIKPQGQEKQPVALVLTNSQGQIVLSKTLDNGQVADRTVLDLQKLPAGVYTLRVTTGGVTELKKLVVTH